MQRARRSDPYPWTWEPAVAILLGLLLVLLLGLQLGRCIANFVAGCGWVWPDRGVLITSLPKLLGGDAGAGLRRLQDVAGPRLLWSVVTAVEVLVVAALAWVARVGIVRWGPHRLQGVATRGEAERMLGRGRLRKVAPMVRPDLHGKDPRGE